MIKLSKRLQTIADLVDKCNVFSDIGCDHALLDIYLIQNKKIKKAIACDITKGAINQANININKYGVKNIETRLGDGLTVIDKNDKINTIVFSGLGGSKITDILKKEESKITFDTIIVQANNGIYLVRKYLTSIGYYIYNEKIVKDNNIIYVVIKFKKGNKKYSKKELLYGTSYIKDNDLYKEYINNIINKNKYIINKIPNKLFIKKVILKIRNKKLSKYI